MDKLTREEVERCARALGWTRDDGKQDTHWHTDTQWVVRDDEFDLHPHFWFGRLYTRMLDLLPCGETQIVIQKTSGKYLGIDEIERVEYRTSQMVYSTFWKSGREYNDHPCLALCEAIEKIQNSHGSEDVNRR